MSKILLSVLAAVALLAGGPARAADDEPWKDPSTALVIDAYELNIIEWDKLVANKRIAGFISKASDGLPEVYDCRKPHRGDTANHCKTMWRKYAVSRELYQTRRMLAKAHGLLWGAYHLARPGNPVDQANHFLDYAEPAADEMMVLDLEGLDTSEFMSLEDAETFARHIKARTGRYPVLYTNHVTARHIAVRREQYRLLSRLPLWYARYKPDIKGVFPMGNWSNYLLWQFSSATNCGRKTCPMRIDGTLPDIDVNTVPMSAKALAAVWPQGGLVEERAPELQHLVIASGALGTSMLPSGPAEARAFIRRRPTEVTALNYQDF
ncbi:MAG TPA: lysozyme [Alphaproteobacteria bacterium]|nr:lysozyme [Alphaproteobacteria bacterium]